MCPVVSVVLPEYSLSGRRYRERYESLTRAKGLLKTSLSGCPVGKLAEDGRSKTG